MRYSLEGILERSPIATFVIDRDHKVIFWNRACEELTGLKAKDMVGTDYQWKPFYREKRPVIADLIVDNDLKGLDHYYGQKQVQKSSVVAEAFEARDYYDDLCGRRRHLYFLAAPIRDEKGEVIAAIETLQDVTRERDLEISLKEYAESLKRELDENITLRKTIGGIIEGSPIPAFVINKNHKVIFWNRAFAALSGYQAKDMVGTDYQWKPFYREKRPVIADLIVDNDLKGLDHYYGQKQVQKSSVVAEAFEARDYYDDLGGKRRHLYFLAAPIRDEKGEVIAAIETLQDVTRERDLEISLKEYAETLKNELDENIYLRRNIEELYNFIRSVLESSPDRIFALTNDGIVNYVSQGLHEEGSAVEEMRGRHFIEFIGLADRDFMRERWAEIKQNIYKPFEIETIAGDGSKKSLLMTAKPIKGTDRYILIQRDITEFKELERKYYESQKLAAVGQLSAGIAHELRNPLSSIKMSLQILQKRMNPTGNDLKRFEIARKEVDHLEKLVSDILVFAKPSEPNLIPGDLNKFVENSLYMAELEISEKKIDVRLNLSNSIQMLPFDSSLLQQAFLNVYLNGIDAMELGGILTITTHLDDGGKFAVVEIGDNGSGIDESVFPYIFNPFFTTKKYGTGLGLSQVKKIIDQHHGTLEIKSRKGEGTKVVLQLPLSA